MNGVVTERQARIALTWVAIGIVLTLGAQRLWTWATTDHLYFVRTPVVVGGSSYNGSLVLACEGTPHPEAKLSKCSVYGLDLNEKVP